MNTHSRNSLTYQLATFRFAFKGLRWFFANETKASIHGICAAAAIILGILLKISMMEWMMIATAIGLVFITEILNTGIELTVDRLVSGPDETAGRIKDLAAGAVLTASLTALAIGMIVFLPKLFEIISGIFS